MSLHNTLRSAPFQAIALVGLALVFATLSNAVAPASRHLAWTGRPPVPPQESAVISAPIPSSIPTAVEIAPIKTMTISSIAASKPTSPKTNVASPVVLPAERFPADPAHPIRDIQSKEALEAYQNAIPFLDARRSADYAEGHVARAWNLCVWESDLDARITEFEATAQPSAKSPMVLYCSGGDCEDSQLLASKLMTLGYRNLLIYRDGYPDWVKQGRPIAKGARP